MPHFSLFVVQKLLVDVQSSAVIQIGRFLLIFFCHLPKGVGDLRSSGYTRLPQANACKLNQISERIQSSLPPLAGK